MAKELLRRKKANKLDKFFLMVERSHFIKNSAQLSHYINQATLKLAEVAEAKKSVSQQELKDLIKVFHDFNTQYDPSFFSDKKLVPEELSSPIENALKAILLFQNATQKEKAIQKNIDQAIVILVSQLNREIKTFDKNLRDLKKIRIGRHIEKTNKSKHS